MSNINNEQAVQWLTSLSDNLGQFRKKTRLAPGNRISFIQEQYRSLYLLHRAVEGSVMFVGAPQIFHTEESPTE